MSLEALLDPCQVFAFFTMYTMWNGCISSRKNKIQLFVGLIHSVEDLDEDDPSKEPGLTVMDVLTQLKLVDDTSLWMECLYPSETIN